MGVFKDIKEIKDSVEQINKMTLKKASELDRILALLKDVKINVKSAAILFDQARLNYKLRIELQVPTIELVFDENNEVSESPLLRAINLLNLIGTEDTMLLARKLEEVKEKNRQNDTR